MLSVHFQKVSMHMVSHKRYHPYITALSEEKYQIRKSYSLLLF